jgi:hypothetical protein
LHCKLEQFSNNYIIIRIGIFRRFNNMTNKRLVVIGGDAAGMSAAAQARRLNPGLEIIAFEKGAHTSFSA